MEEERQMTDPTQEDYKVDLGRDTSGFLDEIRTVRSQAETALRAIGENPVYWIVPPQPIYGPPEPYTWTDRRGEVHTSTRRSFLGYSEGTSIPHPGGAEAVAALKELLEKLEPFRRVGKTPKK
jgi:hypothetical protein